MKLFINVWLFTQTIVIVLLVSLYFIDLNELIAIIG